MALPTTPTAFVWDTEVVDTLDHYDNTTGVITFPFKGTYTTTLHFNVESTVSTQQFYAAAQVYSGGVWTPLEYTTRQDNAKSGDAKQTLFVSTNLFEANTQIRWVVWCSASMNIRTQSPTAGYTIPAARLQIAGTKQYDKKGGLMSIINKAHAVAERASNVAMYGGAGLATITISEICQIAGVVLAALGFIYNIYHKEQVLKEIKKKDSITFKED